tara:strand:- start:11492 stop:11665 length:174 start_codon:yes stop_codon:yes gene_type:complete
MKILITIAIIIASIFVSFMLFIIIGMSIERRRKQKRFNKDLEDYYIKYDKHFSNKNK